MTMMIRTRTEMLVIIRMRTEMTIKIGTRANMTMMIRKEHIFMPMMVRTDMAMIRKHRYGNDDQN